MERKSIAGTLRLAGEASPGSNRRPLCFQGFTSTANHDVGLVQETLGPLPLAGFFGNGEIGPVGQTTHLHGYTTVLGLLRPRSG